VVNLNLVLESSGATGCRKGGSSFAAVNTVIINLAGCLGGLSAGLLAQTLDHWHWQPTAASKNFTFYDVLFVASAGLRLLAVVMLVPLLIEPTARSTRQTFRYVGTALACVFIESPRQWLREVARSIGLLATARLHK